MSIQKDRWISLSTIEFRKNLGIELRRFREGRNMSQEQFAELCGISRAYYGRIERGEYAATIDTCYKIAAALEIQVHELFKNIYM